MNQIITNALRAIDAAAEALSAARAALGGVATSPEAIYDSYLTDVLGEDGAWRPIWLDSLNAEYAPPDGFIGGPEPDHDGDPATTRRRKVVMIGGFYFDRALVRTDLTREQQAGIHHWTQWAFAGNALAMNSDTVTGYPRLPPMFIGGGQAVEAAKPGEALLLAVPAQFYPTGQALYLATRRLYDLTLRM